VAAARAMWRNAAIGFLSAGTGPGRRRARRAVSFTPCWCPRRPASYVWVGAQMRAPDDAATPVLPCACHASWSRRGGSPGRAAVPPGQRAWMPTWRAAGLCAWRGPTSVGQVNSAAKRQGECWGSGRLGSAVPSGSCMVWAGAACGSYRCVADSAAVGWAMRNGAQAKASRQGLCRQRR
jgi:hypothetical protein